MPADVPRLGLGTYSDANRDRWERVVERALDLGYRHVDTAQVYGNEEFVGRGLARADVPREEVFLATKVVHPDAPAPERDDVIAAAEACLDRLGVDYVDLLYVHWPADGYGPAVTMPAFDELVDRGLVRRVGVSNFGTDQLDAARAALDAPLFAHQVEMHPLLTREDLLAYAREHDHWLVAYCPLARTEAFDRPEVRTVAEKHGATPAQVCLAWLLAKENVAAIPKASSEDHLRDNLAARELSLDPEDVERIDAIDDEKRLIDREYAPWNR